MNKLNSAKNILKKNSSTFFIAGFFLPKKTFEDASLLYSFCRKVDDIADKSKDKTSAKKKLISLKRKILKKGKNNEYHELFKNKISLIAACDLIDTVQKDLLNVRLKSKKDLIEYCYGVAGTVGIMMCSILEVKNFCEAWRHAVDLGIAMQLTNISRDVLEDAKLSRRYIPSDLLGNLEPKTIMDLNSSNDLHLRNSIKTIINESEKFYMSGFKGISYIPRSFRFAILCSGLFYREIGLQLIRKDCKNWRVRSVVSNTKKIILFFKVFQKIFFLKENNIKHETYLHNSISEILNKYSERLI